MKIGIYGGTFDPIHLGHMAAARAVAQGMGLELLLLIPAGLPPHKALSAASAPAEQRLAMTRLAAERLGLGIPVKVLPLELAREGKSYTSETLRLLREQYPTDELWLLMGTDMFLSLHSWHSPERVLSLAGVCAFGREAEDRRAEFLAQERALRRDFPGCRIALLTIPELVEVSSTQLRAELAAGREPQGLDPSVYGHILRHGLYGTGARLDRLSLSQLRAVSYSMVKAKRLPHLRGIEQEAVQLARHWGADAEQARRAAILHDCTKYLDLQQQLALCAQYQLPVDEVERHALKLLHAKTGAALAERLFGMEPAVCSAIRWHTTGRADMSLLEKIIYIADYMEPSRDFPGVERLRALVYRDLDAAVALGLSMSIEELRDCGAPVYYRTQEALDWLQRRRKESELSL